MKTFSHISSKLFIFISIYLMKRKGYTVKEKSLILIFVPNNFFLWYIFHIRFFALTERYNISFNLLKIILLYVDFFH